MDTRDVAEEEITVKDLVRILGGGRYWIMGITAVLTLIVLVYSLVAPKKYDVGIIVSPVADESTGSRLSSLVSQVSGLSSLTSLGGMSNSTNTQKAEIVAVLQSNELTRAYIEQNHLLPVLYANKWDAAQNKWKVQGKNIPTVWQANVLFRKRIRTVTADPKTGLVVMTITWRDPVLAAKWANDLVRLTNQYMQKKAIDEAERNIAYLTEQAAKTDAVGIREAIYQILQDEIKKTMLARGGDEYALKVIDRAVAPERPASPDPVVWTLLAFLGGLFLSVFFVLVRHWWRTT